MLVDRQNMGGCSLFAVAVYTSRTYLRMPVIGKLERGYGTALLARRIPQVEAVQLLISREMNTESPMSAITSLRCNIG